MYLLGKAYYRLSRYPEARKVLIEAGRRFPDDPFARRGRFLLGDVDFADKKYLAAEKQYRIAFVNHPEGLLAFRSRLKRARCLRRAGKFELLEKYFRESFEGDDLGRAEWDVEDNSERARYREIYYKMLFEYGDFLMELKKYGEAVPIFKRVVAEYPEGEDRLWSRYMVGKAYELDNQTDRAIEQYRKIVNENARGFWAEQAQFNLNTLLWESRYNEQAMKVGGTYPEQ
jgi:tetratricopeptide (TPR) repeat protein